MEYLPKSGPACGVRGNPGNENGIRFLISKTDVQPTFLFGELLGLLGVGLGLPHNCYSDCPSKQIEITLIFKFFHVFLLSHCFCFDFSSACTVAGNSNALIDQTKIDQEKPLAKKQKKINQSK